MRSLFFSLALAGVLTATGAAGADPPVTWSILVAENGAVIGHGSHQVVRDGAGRQVIDTQDIALREQPGLITRVSERTVRREDGKGRTISISVSSQAGKSWTKEDARIEDGKAVITRETASDRRVTTVPLTAGVRFDGGEALLRAWDGGKTRSISFEQLDLDGMVVERVVIEAAQGAAPDPAGRTAAIRTRYHGQELRGVARLSLDTENRIVSVTQPSFGTNITLKPADRATALRSHPPYQVLTNLMTKSPFRISEPATAGHIRYRFAFRDGLEFSPPQTSEQGVSMASGEATVDICKTCGPGLASDSATLADALKPTAWLQSDSRKLRDIADPIARQAVSDARKMDLLAQKTRGIIARVDFTGHYSALETLARGAGDCTESAVVLAALGRAAGIPTRVANGMVYSREIYHGVSNVFMPHSWVLAYVDGKWRSFDAALGDFDTTHIALTVGDGDVRSVVAAGQLASLLRWESLAEVRTRPAA